MEASSLVAVPWCGDKSELDTEHVLAVKETGGMKYYRNNIKTKLSEMYNV
jgi:hypothetical protein